MHLPGWFRVMCGPRQPSKGNTATCVVFDRVLAFVSSDAWKALMGRLSPPQRERQRNRQHHAGLQRFPAPKCASISPENSRPVGFYDYRVGIFSTPTSLARRAILPRRGRSGPWGFTTCRRVLAAFSFARSVTQVMPNRSSNNLFSRNQRVIMRSADWFPL